MKTGTFTATLLILLGVTWTLYLEYGNKRFINNLPKGPTIGGPPAVPTGTPAASENGETLATDTVLSTPIDENIPVETARTHTHAHPHTSAIDSEPTETLSEEQSFEMRGTLNLAPASPTSSEANKSLDFFREEQRAAMATLERFKMNPDNYLRGEPGEIGSIFVLTESESAEFWEANYVLNPIPENRPDTLIPAAQKRRVAPPPSLETHEVVPLKGAYTLYIPTR